SLTMAPRVKASLDRYHELLEYLTIASKPQLTAICANLHESLLRLFTDIAFNLMYNKHMNLKVNHLEGLKKHKNAIKKLAARHRGKRLTVNGKRRLMRVHGPNILPVLAAPVLDAIAAAQPNSLN